MVNRLIVGALVAVCVITAGASAVQAQEGAEEDQIRSVLEQYVIGWRDGDVARLSTVFATEEGRVFWLTGNAGSEGLASMTFAEILEGRRAQPEYGRTWRVVMLDVVDDQLAAAKLEISRAGGSCVDYLLLQKIAGKWRIVTKAFVTR